MKRIPQFDGLRAIAFFLVFLHHGFRIPLLWVGVDIFFVLSGFLITMILLKQKGKENYFLNFYARRTLRILPPYYLFLLIAFLIPAHSMAQLSPWPYIFFVSNITDSFGITFSPVLNPMWSLGVEEQFYLLWAPLIWFTPRKVFPWVCTFFILFAPLFRATVTAIYPQSFLPVYRLLFSRFDLLATGGLIAWCFLYNENILRFLKRIQGYLFLLPAFIFITFALTYQNFRTSAHSFFFNTTGYTLILLSITGFFLMLLDSNHIFSKLLSWKPLCFLGLISYSMYLSHRYFLVLTDQIQIQHFVRVLLSFGFTAGYSIGVWYLIEKPLMKWKEERWKYRSAVLADVKT